MHDIAKPVATNSRRFSARGLRFAIGLIVAHQYAIALVIGAVFGIGYGAYTSVDWALATDVLPNMDDAAKDMGIWHIALTVPQLIATPLAGFLLDTGQRLGKAQGLPTLGYTIMFGAAIAISVGANWMFSQDGVDDSSS